MLTREVVRTMNLFDLRCWIGIKIDFLEAFDGIECNFIQRILEQIGFHGTLLIESCNASLVPPLFYSILINGSLMDFSMFKEAKGKITFCFSPYSFLRKLKQTHWMEI